PQSVPFCSPIFGGLCEGKRILIQGCVLVSAKRFSVNLVCANRDIAFHFNPRFDEGNIIVCNTQEKGYWGPEERTSSMLFQRGVSFEVIINIRSCGGSKHEPVQHHHQGAAGGSNKSRHHLLMCLCVCVCVCVLFSFLRVLSHVTVVLSKL
uniref:Galectin n=1 Tax=Laticauda laticaudata TaxID=8630 RepID=A0A8C5WNW2_LATLA